MLSHVLKSKIHSAVVTQAELYYQGSCTIDVELLEQCNMHVNEQVHVLNVNNGQRFVTYILAGERGSGTICLNGACARLGSVGDRVIIVTYGLVDDRELVAHKPNIIVLNENNGIISRI